MDANSAGTHLLGIYSLDGRQRKVLAHETDEGGVFALVDVLVTPVDGDDDPRVIEHGITCLGESKSIAEDYIRLATELGWPPMPDAWW